LALLDLYRQGALRFEQVVALGELQISWIGSDEGEILATDEFDIPVTPENETEEGKNV
jgi:segregation and condensation protein A